MKNWKRNAFCLLLTAMVCLLAACGKEEATPDDAVAGDDWRTTGIVDDYGTITRDGTDTDVCIVVREDDTTSAEKNTSCTRRFACCTTSTSP